MQINLLNPGIKEFFKLLGWPLFILLLWFNGCSNDVTTVKVMVPAVVGKLESKKPESKPLEIKQTPISEVKKDGLVYVENPLNKKLLAENVQLKADFEKLKSDSLKSKAYGKAIEINSFSYKSEDKYLKLKIDGLVRGEVQELTPTYELKEREVEAAAKETYLRVLIGASLGINTDLDRGVYKFDIDFQNKKGDIFSAEYMRVNGLDFGVVGIKKSILNLKR
ncbi:hypothetical protein [Flavobacterium sp. FlaQc-50]|uniref:hypothetical protein n=1 Tax=unclassified Flavobacterium TaxID=196869 RepID=UPI00375682D2